jgi:hypothetical protein
MMQKVNHNRFNDETWERIYQTRASLATYKQKVQPYPLLPEEPVSDIENRLNNLEAISSQQGSIPRQYHDELQGIKGQVLYLQTKVTENQKQKTVTQLKKQDTSHGVAL